MAKKIGPEAGSMSMADFGLLATSAALAGIIAGTLLGFGLPKLHADVRGGQAAVENMRLP